MSTSPESVLAADTLLVTWPGTHLGQVRQSMAQTVLGCPVTCWPEQGVPWPRLSSLAVRRVLIAPEAQRTRVLSFGSQQVCSFRFEQPQHWFWFLRRRCREVCAFGNWEGRPLQQGADGPVAALSLLFHDLRYWLKEGKTRAVRETVSFLAEMPEAEMVPFRVLARSSRDDGWHGPPGQEQRTEQDRQRLQGLLDSGPRAARPSAVLLELAQRFMEAGQALRVGNPIPAAALCSWLTQHFPSGEVFEP